MTRKLLLYSDGGARGNPGPAAAAFIATNETGVTLKADSRYLGIRTNNQAEYQALLMALQYARELKVPEVICHLDSELVVRQLKGQYAVRDEKLRELFVQVKELLGGFEKAEFVSVPREHPKIGMADALVNKKLDEASRKPRQSKTANNASYGSLSGLFLHASIQTNNLQGSIDFYRKYFGLEVKNRITLKNNAELTFLQDPQGKGCTLELTYYRNQTQPQKRLFEHLGFEVPDINRTVAAMKKDGITVIEEPSKVDEHITIAFVEDPDGTPIELVERA